MGTAFAAVSGNLVVVYEEIKIFALFLQLHPQYFADFCIRNYFRFSENDFHKWLENLALNLFII